MFSILMYYCIYDYWSFNIDVFLFVRIVNKVVGNMFIMKILLQHL